MPSDSSLRKFELYAASVVAAVVVLQFAFVFSGPFVAEDFGTLSTPSESQSNAPARVDTNSQPTPPEPALRVLEGAVGYG